MSSYNKSYNKKWKYRHREVWTNHQRKKNPSYRIPYKWHIHHINHNKKDNRIRNLIALPPHLHNWVHFKYWKTGKIYNKTEITKLIIQYKKNRKLKKWKIPYKFIFKNIHRK